MQYTIGQLAEIIDGDRGINYPKMDEFHNNGFCLFLNTSNVTKDGFAFEDKQFITEEKDKILRKGHLNRGDIVFTTRGTVGNVALYSVSVPYENMRINSGMVILRCRNSIVDTRFIYHLLKSKNCRTYIKSFCTGSAQPQLPIKNLSTIILEIPSLQKQSKIADIVSAYDDLIETNQRQIKLLEETAQRLYKEWFVDMRFPGHENVQMIDGLPEGWKRTVFSERVDVLSGGTPKTSNPEYYNGSIPFYSPKDSDDRFFAFDTETHISESGLENCSSKLYPEGTIIITARGTVGKTTILARPMAMNQSCYALKSSEVMSIYYLFFALRQEIMALKTMANGGVFDTIIVKTFDRIKLITPTDLLMQSFDKHVSPIMEKIKSLLIEIRYLSETRDRLLPKLMSGEIEV